MPKNLPDLYFEVKVCHEETSGSCHFVTAHFPSNKKTSFIVDCGLFKEYAYLKYNNLPTAILNNAKFAIATHDHLDHIGLFPKIVRNGFSGKIYTSSITHSKMEKALRRHAEKLVNKAFINNKEPLYHLYDVEQTLPLINSLNYNEEFMVCENISITLFENEHCPGASYILVKIIYPERDNLYILFTGDYYISNIDKEIFPSYVYSLPINIVTEATYCEKKETTSHNHVSINDIEAFLSKFQNIKTLLINHGTKKAKLSLQRFILNSKLTQNVKIESKNKRVLLSKYGPLN